MHLRSVMDNSLALRGSLLALLLAGCSPPTANTSSGHLTASNLSGSQSSDTIQVFNWQDQENVFPATLSASPTSDFNANNCEFYVSDHRPETSPQTAPTTNWCSRSTSRPTSSSPVRCSRSACSPRPPTARAPSRSATSCRPTTAAAATRPATPTEKSRARARRPRPSRRPCRKYAFFIDVQQADGSIARLWQSDGGHNYLNDAVFQGTPGHVYQAGNTTTDYANASSYIFWQKDACANLEAVAERHDR